MVTPQGTIQVLWNPQSPRIGDRVLLTLKRATPRDAAPGLDIPKIPGLVLISRESSQSTYSILVKKAGDFKLEAWDTPLWKVPEENHFPEGWVLKSQNDLFNSLLWPWVFALVLTATAGAFGIWKLVSKPAPPGSPDPVIGSLWSHKTSLHSQDL